MVRPRARSMRRARKTRRLRMRGGMWLWDSTPSSTDTWRSWFSKQVEKVTGAAPANQPVAPANQPVAPANQSVAPANQPAAPANQPAAPEMIGFGQQATTSGGKRRKKRRRMRGGNGDQSNIGSVSVTPSMYKYGSDAAEVHDIQMAQPDTLVGGRRRRRGSRSRGRSRRRSSRRN
jgi:hypothetical protein